MSRLSSRGTFVMKWLFPTFWFGFLAMLLTVIARGAWVKGELGGLLVVFPLILAFGGFGYVVMRIYLFDLADTVWDEGNALLVKKGRREERIALADIMNVGYSGFQNPPRVTLYLRAASAFGTEVAFMPRYRPFPFRMPAEIRELMMRVDEARRR